MYTIDVENNRYEAVKIGDLYWTVENLKTTKFNDGTEIELIADYEEWEDAGKNNIPAYCYYDMDNKKYGALYNYHAVSTGLLAPAGWRVPTNEDWKCLEKYLISSGYNCDGSIGNDLTRNNKSGFSSLPGGYRGCDGYFYDIGYHCSWWSATESDASYTYHRYLYHNKEHLVRYYYNKGSGFSVRVVRDV